MSIQFETPVHSEILRTINSNLKPADNRLTLRMFQKMAGGVQKGLLSRVLDDFCKPEYGLLERGYFYFLEDGDDLRILKNKDVVRARNDGEDCVYDSKEGVFVDFDDIYTSYRITSLFREVGRSLYTVGVLETSHC